MNVQAVSFAAVTPPVRATGTAAPATGRGALDASAAITPSAAPPVLDGLSSLLEVLTPDERAFFLFRAENAPFVYRPGGGGSPIDFMPPSLGRALDARG
jgi:hypothetical protein